MADYSYAYKGKTDGVAKAVAKDAPISTKVAIEISNYLRGRNTKKAKAILERVIKQEQAIPYKRFTDGVGHKKGAIAAGRYPEKASKAFLALIASAEANAAQLGLADELVITHLAAHQAARPFHYGRLRRRQVKATHVEIVLAEDEKAEKKAKPKKKATAKKTSASATTPAEKKTTEKESEQKTTAEKPVEKKTEKPAEEKKEAAKDDEKKKETAPKAEKKDEKPTGDVQ